MPAKRGRPKARPRATATLRSYLEERARFGIKFGLETMQELTAALGHPERAFASLLVAGTNGKGSVTAYADAGLRAAGLRVGRYTSPHLVRVHERIAVGGRDISELALARAVGAVRDAAAGLVAAGRLRAHPTYFETLTAAAFFHFKAAAVQVAVLEVGMGGRLDATNAAEPLASAIVSIDYDHEGFLGTTLAAIAREKAGVLRPGRTTVLGPLPGEAQHAIATEAGARGARLVCAYDGVSLRETAGGLEVTTPSGFYPGLRPLPGAHQRDNLVVALRLVEAVLAAGQAADQGRVATGLTRVRWPGRLERIPGRPPLLLDGAHNPGGARALALYLEDQRPFVLLFGVMADKDARQLGETLFPLAREVVLTQPPIERAATPQEIAAHAGRVAARAHQEPSVRRALALARRLARPGETVVVAGSLYLVGAVTALIKPRK